MDLNQAVLDQICTWGRAFHGFTQGHARNGLALVQLCAEGVPDAAGTLIPGVGPQDEHGLYLLGKHMAWLFWLDERFDAPPDRGVVVDYPALLQAFEERPRTPEGEALSAVRESLFRLPRSAAARRLWDDTARASFHACRENDLLARGERSWSYAEYLHNSEHSGSLPNVVATISLVYDLDMPARLLCPSLRSMIHHLSMVVRLQNDLASVDKERASGERANAVLLLEGLMPTPQARAFALADLKGYTRLLERDLDSLGTLDPFARLAHVLLGAAAHVYRSDARYNEAAY
jgi:hypothetical protein